MRLGNTTLATAFLAGAILCAAAASATTITFSGLSDANGTPVAMYTESGYTFVPFIGSQFFEGQIFGNPVPSLVAGPVFGGPADNTLNIFFSGGILVSDHSIWQPITEKRITKSSVVWVASRNIFLTGSSPAIPELSIPS